MLYTFYGDDFTGSTDVLEQLASNGVTAVLFLSLPTQEQLARFGNVQAVGIAGDSRSRSPEWMTANLPLIFTVLEKFGAPVNHYKVCSTFDSSPNHGSIGRAIEIGLKIFRPEFVPILVAAPHLRRYVIFGNLFAAAPDGTIQRIDRHPMSQHPVTPMHEADLKVHLASQTKFPVGIVDLMIFQQGREAAELDSQLERGNRIVLFDGIDEQTLVSTGALLWNRAKRHPIFSASSSGLTAALVTAWRTAGLNQEILSSFKETKRRTDPLLVLSGSRSPATALQIRWALDHYFYGIAIDPTRLLDDQNRRDEFTRIRNQAEAHLRAGRSTVLYTALGPAEESAAGNELGISLGHLLRELLHTTGMRRVLLCGGDTSSHAIQQLGIYALTWMNQIQPGAPLCRAFSEVPALNGLELVLKGGQVGTPDFFQTVLQA